MMFIFYPQTIKGLPIYTYSPQTFFFIAFFYIFSSSWFLLVLSQTKLLKIQSFVGHLTNQFGVSHCYLENEFHAWASDNNFSDDGWQDDRSRDSLRAHACRPPCYLSCSLMLAVSFMNSKRRTILLGERV